MNLPKKEGRITVTRDGEPVALVVGMENRDAEDFAYMTSPEFWQMIAETRRMPTISLDQAKKELFGNEGEDSAPNDNGASRGHS